MSQTKQCTHVATTNIHKLLQHLIHTYIQTYKTPQNIIIMETIPSLIHDIHPYNNAAFSICRGAGVRFCKTLVGEPHLWDDGIHVRHEFRPLLVKAVAAAILNVDPHAHFRLSRPPHGPYGPWFSPWGNINRPFPSSRWPPPELIGGRRPKSFRDAATAPSLALRQTFRGAVAVPSLPIRLSRNIQ